MPTWKETGGHHLQGPSLPFVAPAPRPQFIQLPDISAGGTTYTKTGIAAVDFTASGPGDAIWTETGGATLPYAASGTGDTVFSETGAGTVPFTAAGPGDAIRVETGGGAVPYAAAGSGDVVFTETGSATVVFTGGAIEYRYVTKTGGATVPFTAAGASLYLAGALGMSVSGPALIPDDGSYHVKTGRVHLELGAAGQATVEIDEWTRLLTRRTEQVRILELVGAL